VLNLESSFDQSDAICSMGKLLKTWWFFSTMLTALSMAAAFAHLLELPGKMTYDGALWVRLLQTLYPAFGKISGLCEIGAVVTAAVLALLLRHHRPAFGWALVAALAMIATHAIFWVWVAPVNAALLPVTPATLPADWAALRDQWEYAHAARAVLQILALGALLLVALAADRPARGLSGNPPRLD
jgi:hypothetical protein